MVNPQWREDTPKAAATPTQRLLAAAHAERMKRWHTAKEPPPKPAPPPPAEPIQPPASESARILPDWVTQWLDHWTAMATKPTAPGISYRLVQQVTAKHFGLTREQMLSPSRVQRCVRARQVGMVLCLELVPTAGLAPVGRWFKRDHTTVIHARNAINHLISEPEFAAKIDVIRQEIKASA